MKKAVCFGLTAVFCMGMLSGCGNKMKVERSTVYVEKKGQIVSVDVGKLDKDYYDATELEEYITDRVAEYTGTNGDVVEKEDFETADGVAKLQLKYDSYEDYAKLNGIEFYTGTVVTAMAEGYDFDTEFIAASAEDGKAGEALDESTESGAVYTVSKQEALEDDGNKVVIIKANVDVKVDGTVLYVSSQDTQVTGRDTVSITGDGADEEAALTYIIYK